MEKHVPLAGCLLAAGLARLLTLVCRRGGFNRKQNLSLHPLVSERSSESRSTPTQRMHPSQTKNPLPNNVPPPGGSRFPKKGRGIAPPAWPFLRQLLARIHRRCLPHRAQGGGGGGGGRGLRGVLETRTNRQPGGGGTSVYVLFPHWQYDIRFTFPSTINLKNSINMLPVLFLTNLTPPETNSCDRRLSKRLVENTLADFD